MKFLLHSVAYCERGDTVNARNYYYALSKIGISSILTFEANNDGNNYAVIDSLKKEKIPFWAYSSKLDLDKFAKSEGITHSYLLKNGQNNGFLIESTINCVHSVFGFFEPHGDRYAYVSEWLFNSIVNKHKLRQNNFSLGPKEKTVFGSADVNNLVNWVPHIVSPAMPDSEFNLRTYLDISKSDKIIGRIGGFNQFDDPILATVINEVLKSDKNVTFVFINTKPFINHQKVKYLNNKYISESEKSAFFSQCHLTLNGRLGGESFGFSVLESLFHGVPVLAPNLTRNPTMDAHHITLLSPLGLLYNDGQDLYQKILILLDRKFSPEILKNVCTPFREEKVMERFLEVFS